MGKPEPLWKALSFSSLMLGIGAVMGGNASAQVHGNAEFFPASICLFFVIFAQLAANAYHRYNAMVLLWGNEPKVTQAKLDRDPAYGKFLFYRVFSLGLSLMALMAGCCLIAMGGIWFAFVGLLVAVLGWGMIGGKSPLLLSTWGCVFTFILFGPVAVISTSLLQSSHETTDPLSWFDISPALFMSATIGFMAANAYLVFVYGSYFKQKKLMRETFPATYGRRATRTLFLINSILASGILLFSCFDLALYNRWLGFIPSMGCLGVNIYIWWRMKKDPGHKMLALANWACFNVLLMGCLSSIVSLFVGVPDDSHMHLF